MVVQEQLFMHWQPEVALRCSHFRKFRKPLCIELHVVVCVFMNIKQIALLIYQEGVTLFTT